jgi:hypothetical protein
MTDPRRRYPRYNTRQIEETAGALQRQFKIRLAQRYMVSWHAMEIRLRNWPLRIRQAIDPAFERGLPSLPWPETLPAPRAGNPPRASGGVAPAWHSQPMQEAPNAAPRSRWRTTLRNRFPSASPPNS